MMTVNLDVSRKPDSQGFYRIVVRITHNNKHKRIALDQRVHTSDWRKRRVENRYYLASSCTNYNEIMAQYEGTKAQVLQYKDEILKRDLQFTIDELQRGFGTDQASDSEIGFFRYAYSWLTALQETNRISYYKKCLAVVRNFAKFKYGVGFNEAKFIDQGFKNDLPFTELSVKLLNRFENYLKGRDRRTNTIYINLKTIRTIYYAADREDQFTEVKNPFRKKKLVQAKTEKKALSLDEIVTIEKANVPENLRKTKDLFLFSFYCAGMRWGDVCTLKNKDFKNGNIGYRMRKTLKTSNKVKTIKLIDKALEIANKYHDGSRPNAYLFSIIPNDSTEAELIPRIGSKNAIINCSLKKLAKFAGVNLGLSFHMSRHSYASLANSKSVAIGVISELLGHSDIKTTQIYLKELDQEVVETAHMGILDY